ncbi:MAG: LysR family transcriptional regulator [Oscillospiraceae bacterium]|nr:LysR family transcriptional regulator [Oscillospiraceae bacterium]
MDLRTLSYFVAVAEELNITKAAERLNLSQPPLSSQMKHLEDELRTTLFLRGKRRLELTESGQLLYRRAKEILSLSQKAEDEILSMSQGMTGTISIGLVEGMAPDIAAEWFVAFNRAHPKVRFRILDGSSDDLIDKLRSGLISLAVITAPYDQQLLNAFSVGREKIVAFLSKDHPLAQKTGNAIDIADLKNEPLIVPSRRATIEMIYKWFREIRSEPKILCEMDSYLDAAALAGRNLGISLFPRTAYVPNRSLVAKELTGEGHSVDYLFVWRKGRPLPTAEEAFIDAVKARFAKEP